MAQIDIHDYFMEGYTVDETFRAVAALASTRKGLRVETPMPGTLVLVNRYCPTWAIIVGFLGLIVLVGLLFFAVKTEDRVTFVGPDVEGGSRYSVTGVAVPDLRKWIDRNFSQV